MFPEPPQSPPLQDSLQSIAEKNELPILSNVRDPQNFPIYLLVVGIILLFFGIWGEWKATSTVANESAIYTQLVSDTTPDTHRQCNNYIHTENFVRKVHNLAAVNWRRAMITAFFSIIIAIPISNVRCSWRQFDIFVFIVFVSSWCVNGFMDYHLRTVSDTAIEVGTQNTSLSFTDENACNVSAAY